MIKGERALQRKFKSLSRRIKHQMRPCYKRIGIALLNEINTTFKKEEYEGTRWKILAPATIKARREGSGKGEAKILQDTGYLRESFQREVTNRYVKIDINPAIKTIKEGVVTGSPIEYAPYHHFGGRGGKPPKRPIIPSQKRGLQIAIEIADKFIDEKIKQSGLR